MNITYLGHSCFIVDIQGYKLLFDPYITPNNLASNVDINSIEADYILISHGHQDHVEDAEAIAKRTGATIISSHEIVTWYKQKGLTKTHPMNIGGKWKFDFGTVAMVQAVHSNSMPDGTYGGSATGFVIKAAEKTFYYAGDTALFSDMKLIKELYKPEFAFLPIGDNFTMDISAALMAADFVGVKNMIAMHFDTFPYIKIDHSETLDLAKEKGKNLMLLKIGDTITI